MASPYLGAMSGSRATLVASGFVIGTTGPGGYSTTLAPTRPLLPGTYRLYTECASEGYLDAYPEGTVTVAEGEIKVVDFVLHKVVDLTIGELEVYPSSAGTLDVWLPFSSGEETVPGARLYVKDETTNQWIEA